MPHQIRKDAGAPQIRSAQGASRAATVSAPAPGPSLPTRFRKILIPAFAIVLSLSIAAGVADAAERTYYIAADEVLWNFAPANRDVTGNRPLPKPAPAQVGWRYDKVIYREYTDPTFSSLKPRPASDAYLGILGPVIRAEVGDTVTVVFKNNAHQPYSFHVHGLRYDKASEGAPYSDGAGRKIGDAVAPGATFTYHYDVPERSGPGPMDVSSVLWMYHSHTDEVKDVNTGPIGPIVITRRGAANADGSPKDVDREIFTEFAEIDESESRVLGDTLRDPALNPRHLKPDAKNFAGQNQLYTMNGFVYGNMPLFDVKLGRTARFYVFSTMSDFDFHAPHWHGATVVSNGMRTDTVQLGAMGMEVADMVPDEVGTWLYHCHVNVHLQLGMVARYRVVP